MSKKNKILIVSAVVLSLLFVGLSLFIVKEKNKESQVINPIEIYESLLNIFNNPDELSKFGQNVVDQTCQNSQDLFRCVWTDPKRCHTEVQTVVKGCLSNIKSGSIENQGQVVLVYETFKGCLSTELKNRALQMDIGRFTHCTSKK